MFKAAFRINSYKLEHINAVCRALYNTEQQSKAIVIRQDTLQSAIANSNGNKICDEESVSEITTEIRKYSMDVCKMMKRKLAYLNRKHFNIRSDKGSVAKEQLYIDCSTAIYEYFRFFLIRMLKEKMNCTEDLSKRKLYSDNSIDTKSEVEAQHTVQFWHDDIKYNIHITFYYTKCSLWIQGASTKISGLTLAQFFTYHYIESISNMVQNNIPLKQIGEEMHSRITKFLTVHEMEEITSNKLPITIREEKCVTCARKCYDNNKSMKCVTCGFKQHFQCAGIKPEPERQLFLSGSTPFNCSKCIGSVHNSNNACISAEPITLGIDLCVIEEDETTEITANKSPSTFSNTSATFTYGETDGSAAPQSNPITAKQNGINYIQQDADDVFEETSAIGTNTDRTKTSAEFRGTELTGDLGTPLSKLPFICGTKPKSLQPPPSKVASNNSINPDKLLIRRLQEENNRLVQEHIQKEKRLNDEISAIKEAYRRCMVDYEKEKDTKETLQKCVAALQTADTMKKKSSDNQRSNREIKQKKCLFVSRKGGCNKGKDCLFAHPEENKTLETQVRNPSQEKKIQKECHFYKRKAGCTKGEKCRFLHTNPVANRMKESQTTSVRNMNDSNKVTKMCRFFSSKKGCSKGDQCKFIHEDTSQLNINEQMPVRSFLGEKTWEPQNSQVFQQIIQNSIQMEVQKQVAQLTKEIPNCSNQNHPNGPQTTQNQGQSKQEWTRDTNQNSYPSQMGRQMNQPQVVYQKTPVNEKPQPQQQMQQQQYVTGQQTYMQQPQFHNQTKQFPIYQMMQAY